MARMTILDAIVSFDDARATARKTKTEAIAEWFHSPVGKVNKARRRVRNGKLLVAWRDKILGNARYEHQLVVRDALRVQRRLAVTMPEPKPVWW